MERFYYSDKIVDFLKKTEAEIIGLLSLQDEFASEKNQKDAWIQEIRILKTIVHPYNGSIFFEFSIPRMGRRIDVVLIIENVVFILEFKVGEKEYNTYALEQVWDYALDLKNFHETSQNVLLAPILVATEAQSVGFNISHTSHDDNLILPIKANARNLSIILQNILKFEKGNKINSSLWSEGKYSPTPTIIEAARELYNKNTVYDISRKDATAKNLSHTSKAISEIIQWSKIKNKKSICFVTGVPGAGKTLVGLDIATKHLRKDRKTSSIFLSGNGPLVAILKEALTRDKVKREKEAGRKVTKINVMREVKSFIQNVHHYRDTYLKDFENPPYDHIAIFDEAQRAWNIDQTVSFMKRKKNVPDFIHSEPEFLISCLDRHKDWAVVVCLVGGGQEINKGEAGISEWLDSVNRTFKNWNVFISPNLYDSEYAAGSSLNKLSNLKNIHKRPELHLNVSLRSFRSENLALLIKSILDIDLNSAKKYFISLKNKYPIVISRDLLKAKNWLKEKARGSERFGIIVSSQAERLKPQSIFVNSPMDPVHWFLNEKTDTRSSFYLEDVATEFHVQGLELDWSCVTWDADFRFCDGKWTNYSFVGNKWQNINKAERKLYQKNAYRVLLTRARQGMVIVVPEGDESDHTRLPEFYDGTYNYLKSIGIQEI